MRDTPECGDLTFHSGSHEEYSDAVNRHIGDVRRQFVRGEINVEQARSQLGRLMQNLRSELTSSRYTNMNDPNLLEAIKALRF